MLKFLIPVIVAIAGLVIKYDKYPGYKGGKMREICGSLFKVPMHHRKSLFH
jgi:hypothetical protein